MDRRFLDAVFNTLSFEGGYAFDPEDPGGETKYGISKRAYPEVDIKSLTLDQAREIYARDYWEKVRCPEIRDDLIAAKLFDTAVNLGSMKAVKILQQAVRYLFGVDLAVDGKIGPKTIRACNDCKNPKALLAAMKFLQAQHYVSLSNPKFLAGWLIRAMS